MPWERAQESAYLVGKSAARSISYVFNYGRELPEWCAAINIAIVLGSQTSGDPPPKLSRGDVQKVTDLSATQNEPADREAHDRVQGMILF